MCLGAHQKLLMKIIDFNLQANPLERVRGIIGFGSNALTEKMAPALYAQKMPSIGTREDEYGFGDKVRAETRNILYKIHDFSKFCHFT